MRYVPRFWSSFGGNMKTISGIAVVLLILQRQLRIRLAVSSLFLFKPCESDPVSSHTHLSRRTLAHGEIKITKTSSETTIDSRRADRCRKSFTRKSIQKIS